MGGGARCSADSPEASSTWRAAWGETPASPAGARSSQGAWRSSRLGGAKRAVDVNRTSGRFLVLDDFWVGVGVGVGMFFFLLLFCLCIVCLLFWFSFFVFVCFPGGWGGRGWVAGRVFWLGPGGSCSTRSARVDFPATLLFLRLAKCPCHSLSGCSVLWLGERSPVTSIYALPFWVGFAGKPKGTTRRQNLKMLFCSWGWRQRPKLYSFVGRGEFSEMEVQAALLGERRGKHIVQPALQYTNMSFIT